MSLAAGFFFAWTNGTIRQVHLRQAKDERHDQVSSDDRRGVSRSSARATSLGVNALEVKACLGGVNANVSVGGSKHRAGQGLRGQHRQCQGYGGGGGGNVASTKATVGNNKVTANIGTGNGPLATSTTSGNPTGGLTSGTSINLGGLFGGGGSLPGVLAPGGGIGGGGAAAIGDMSSGEIASMKRQCSSILAMPIATTTA